MGQILVCDGNLVTVVAGGRATIPADLTCDIPWTIKPEPATDFQGLIDLLSFDSGLCAQLIAGCLVLFIMGYSAGMVVRILSRR